MISLSELSINDFSSLFGLLTSIAIILSGVVSIIAALSQRFSKIINHLVNDLKNINHYLIRLQRNNSLPRNSPKYYLLQRTLKDYMYFLRLRKANVWFSGVRARIYRRLVADCLQLVSYTAVFGIFVLVFIGFTEAQEIKFTIKQHPISSHRAVYKVLFLYVCLSVLWMFFLMFKIVSNRFNITRYRWIRKLFVARSSDIPALFARNIGASSIFVISSIYFLVYYYSNNSQGNFREQWTHPYVEYFVNNFNWISRSVAVFGSIVIVLSGYPLLYFFSFVLYQIELLIRKYRIEQNKKILSETFGQPIRNYFSFKRLFFEYTAYSPLFWYSCKRAFKGFLKNYLFNNRIFFFCKAVLKLYGKHLAVVGVILFGAFATFKIYTDSIIFSQKDAEKVLKDANAKQFYLYSHFNSMTEDSIKTIASSYYIRGGQAYTKMIDIIMARKDSSYVLDTTANVSFYDIKSIEIVRIEENEVILKASENWNLEWVMPKNPIHKKIYEGKEVDYQTYIVRKEGGIWKVDANYYRGINRNQVLKNKKAIIGTIQ